MPISKTNNELAPTCDKPHEDNYLERRIKVFEAIASLRPIPISEKTPCTDEILRQIREEEAR